MEHVDYIGGAEELVWCAGGCTAIPDNIQAGAFTMTPEDRYTAIARECARLAELTDNQDLRSHLQALALEMMAEAAPERDDHSNVIEFPRVIDRAS
jgi:hypothetical protein